MAETIDADVRAEIEQRLADIEQNHEVDIIFAIESGSRAWGFSSPDSDYDIRFVYRRKLGDYARLFPQRDVIETPIEDLIDLNGWDVGKTLRLILKSNAVISEWLLSPIRYRWRDDLTELLSNFADEYLREESLRWHYRSLGKRQWKTYVEGKDAVRVKKYFYVIRPVLALRHLRLHRERPPMHMDRLLAETELDQAFLESYDQLYQAKVALNEADTVQRVAVIDTLIEEEMALADQVVGKTPNYGDTAKRAAEERFRQIIDHA